MKNNCQSQLIPQAIAILTLTNVFFLVFSQAALSNSINPTGTLRDFSDQHPDFERQNRQHGFHFGLETTTQENSDQWYRNIPNINQTMEFSIELTDDNSDGVYRYQKEEFLSQALKIIQEFEGFREQAYIDTDGTPVIGYGLSKVDGRKIQLGDRISVTKADAALRKQVLHLQEQIKSMVKVKLNSNQLSALISFAFNVGIHGVKRSTLLKKLNAGDYVGAANEFPRWNKAHVRGQLVPLAGLTRRREAEKQLFLE